MTMTSDELAIIERQNERAWLAAAGPLPPAEEIAGPILQGLYRLAALEDRARAVGMLRDRGEAVDEAAEMLALIERVCTLVRVGAGGYIATQRGVEHGIDRILRAIGGADHVEWAAYHDVVEALAEGRS